MASQRARKEEVVTSQRPKCSS